MVIFIIYVAIVFLGSSGQASMKKTTNEKQKKNKDFIFVRFVEPILIKSMPGSLFIKPLRYQN